MLENKKIKLKVGDNVVVLSSQLNGTIKDIISSGANGDSVFLVNVDGKDKAYLESNLQLVKNYNLKVDFNIDDVAIDFEIEDRLDEIIKKLNLVTSDEDSEQLRNACKLQAYLATKDDNEEININIGSSVTKSELYHGLYESDCDSIVNSYMFSEILKKVGMDVLNVALKNENGNFYVANLVLIGDEYYYFDVTLESVVFKENGANMENFVLSCGALGSDSYEQFFKPLCLLDFNNNLSDNSLPSNIAVSDIDIDIVNKLLIIDKAY